MRKHAVSIAIFGLLVSAAGAQQDQANRITSSADNAFVAKAAQGGMAEVELGNLATQKASDQKVKDFGQRMVDDHTKANDELKALATSKGTALPASIPRTPLPRLASPASMARRSTALTWRTRYATTRKTLPNSSARRITEATRM